MVGKGLPELPPTRNQIFLLEWPRKEIEGPESLSENNQVGPYLLRMSKRILV